MLKCLLFQISILIISEDLFESLLKIKFMCKWIDNNWKVLYIYSHLLITIHTIHSPFNVRMA